MCRAVDRETSGTNRVDGFGRGATIIPAGPVDALPQILCFRSSLGVPGRSLQKIALRPII